MNPALPVVLVLSLAGLLWRRRPAGVAWAVVGVAGAALLAPTLVEPEGIPSPAASLGALVPWQQAGLDAEQGNPGLVDVSYQIQPWLLHLRRELRHGRLPFWNPHQFAGSPFWANGQSAPLYPLHLLFAGLPLQLGFVLLPWLRFLVAGLGAWALARKLGLATPGALVAGVVFPLSGMLVSFLLYPMGNALALVPWVLLATECLAGGAGGWPFLALTAGLQLLAGHPETAIHSGMVTALYLLVRCGVGKGSLGVWLRFAGGWLAGLALAAVQLLPLTLNVLASSKWQQFKAAGEMPDLGLLLTQMLRGVLPHLYGRPPDGTWWGPFNYSATAVYAGALALPLAVAGLAGLAKDRRWRALAVAGAVSLWAAYHLPGSRELLGALPVVGRVLHHRLIFAVELTLALLAGRGLEHWLAGRGRAWFVAGTAVSLSLLAAAWGLYAGEWASRGLAGEQLRWILWGAVAAALPALGLAVPAGRRRRLWPLVPLLLVVDLAVAHGGINPALPLSRLYPIPGAVGFLHQRAGGMPQRVAGVGRALRPNAALVYGLYDPRGDDPVKLERFEALYRRLGGGAAVYFRPLRRWGSPLLDRLGVRWVVAAPGQGPPEPGWRLAWEGPDARVWERPTARAVVRWEGGAGRVVAVETHRPGFWRLEVEAAARGRLVVAEMWDAGWRAQWTAAEGSARQLAVTPDGDGLLELRPPAGAGRLELTYRPPGLLPGLGLSLAALVAMGVAARRRPGGGNPNGVRYQSPG